MTDKLMSLYDFLGKAAGPELGKQINIVFKKNFPELNISRRYVDNQKYKGYVHLYPKWFLEQYFRNSKQYKNPEENNLPF